MLSFTYDLSAHRIIHDPEVRGSFSLMRNAGVDTIYVYGYFYGHFDSEENEIAEAKRILENEGFSTGILNLPAGHGGNALNPNDPTVDLTIGEGWHMRVDKNGSFCPTTTCYDDVMIRDSRKANEIFYQMGYRQIFNDDDLRSASWGSEVQGCFCDSCMEQFSQQAGRPVSRSEIFSDPELCELWMSFQCEKIARFLKLTTPAGMKNGVMMMHNCDRRHGVDAALLQKTMGGDLIFRVGEGHFNDAAFTHPLAQESLKNSILSHIAMVGDPSRCYSESTVFPADALSPENWIKKMELEINCGLRNLFLMSGTWFLSERYWKYLSENRSRLCELAESVPIPKAEQKEFVWQI